MGSPLGRTLHSGCPESWKILGTMQLASVVLAASVLLAATNAAPQLFGPSPSAASSGFVPARDSDATPAKYNYIYKVADDGTQTYISQEEQRDGLEVQGTYSYVDPTGAIVTVNYNAGVNGYEETRSRQEGAVKIAPQKVAAPTSSTSTGLDTDAIIAQVLAALRPTIQTTVGQFVSRG